MNRDVDLMAHEHESEEHTNLVQEFTRFRDDPVESLKTLAKHVFGSSWRAYDDYIGQPLYHHDLFSQVFDKTMNNPGIQECIQDLAQQALERESQTRKFTPQDRESRREELEQWLQSMAAEMVKNMVAKCHHKSVLQLMYYSVAQMFSRTYHQGVHVDASEITMLKAKARELEAKKQSLIFMPCHKSHIDYIAIQVICFRVGLSLPAVVAGDNLNFAVIGPMLRQAGGMFIRRSFSEDPLYQSTVQGYIETVLANGYNFECFVEGTRSRIGKLLPPKFGILKYILEAILSGRVQDSWIVPVSTQYDKVAEAESYATELLGKEKPKESFTEFLNASRILSLKMGRVDVRFKQPWSLKTYVADQLHKMSAEHVERPVSLATALDHGTKTRLLRSLGYRILNDINEASVVMPTSLIGTVLLTSAGGISFKEMVAKVRRLIRMIHDQGGKVGTVSANGGRANDIEAMVQNALKVLGPELVGQEAKGLVEPIYCARDPFKLSYYRNQVIHLFASEALTTVGLYAVRRRTPHHHHHHHHHAAPALDRQQVYDQVGFLSKLLAGEFVYAVEGVDRNFAAVLQRLREHRVVEVQADGALVLKFTTNELQTGGEMFDFYCCLVWPFIDGYWLVSVALFTLTPWNGEHQVWVHEAEFLNVAQALGKTLYYQGRLTYYEAVNKEILKGALAQLASEHIIVRQTFKDKKIPVRIALSPHWHPTRASQDDNLFKTNDILPSGHLYETSEAISECRHATLRHHDPSVTPKGTNLILLRQCSQLGAQYKSRTVVRQSRI